MKSILIAMTFAFSALVMIGCQGQHNDSNNKTEKCCKKDAENCDKSCKNADKKGCCKADSTHCNKDNAAACSKAESCCKNCDDQECMDTCKKVGELSAEEMETVEGKALIEKCQALCEKNGCCKEASHCNKDGKKACCEKGEKKEVE